jgi:hypothetical protein
MKHRIFNYVARIETINLMIEEEVTATNHKHAARLIRNRLSTDFQVEPNEVAILEVYTSKKLVGDGYE